mgnify:FL=1
MKKYFDLGQKLNTNLLAKILSENYTLRLTKIVENKIYKSRSYLEKTISSSNDVIYGVNTGFGSLCDTEINKKDIKILQENLILSHACGVGDLVPKEIAKLMLLLKINSLCLGFSGVRVSLVKHLIKFYNKDLIPVIYEQGSLGASGDLAPLAHMSLPLLGKGDFYSKNGIKKSNIVLKKEGLKLYKLSYKEGLALLNGTQFMLSYAVWSLLKSVKLNKASDLISSISLEAFSCRIDPFSKLISSVRPHQGQLDTINNILNYLKGSKGFYENSDYVQDPYSFRCIPQVHGASKDIVTYFKKIIDIEINSVTDNPIIFEKENKIISGGNFHGQPLAMGMDYLAISLSELGNISERRVFNLISGQRNLPKYLIKNSGLNSGLMISQYTAASIVSQNKQYCTPSSVDSIVSSNGQEDHVSMGANAALKLYKVINNLTTLLSIELMNASQAFQISGKKSSRKINSLIKDYRKEVPFLDTDTDLYRYILKGVDFINNKV